MVVYIYCLHVYTDHCMNMCVLSVCMRVGKHGLWVHVKYIWATSFCYIQCHIHAYMHACMLGS
jgi:hypothetical protein